MLSQQTRDHEYIVVYTYIYIQHMYVCGHVCMQMCVELNNKMKIIFVANDEIM